MRTICQMHRLPTEPTRPSWLLECGFRGEFGHEATCRDVSRSVSSHVQFTSRHPVPGTERLRANPISRHGTGRSPEVVRPCSQSCSGKSALWCLPTLGWCTTPLAEGATWADQVCQVAGWLEPGKGSKKNKNASKNKYNSGYQEKQK